MQPTLQTCNGTYRRDDAGRWRYPWGEEVPGAHDLTLETARQLGVSQVDVDDHVLDGSGSLTRDGGVAANGPVGTNGSGELVIGMIAPELIASLMLCVSDISEIAGVTKATIDSYRYRGYLPEPQVVRSRTPLWTRPIIHHWMQNRPGCGWRTDVYGNDRQSRRRMPVTGNRRVIP